MSNNLKKPQTNYNDSKKIVNQEIKNDKKSDGQKQVNQQEQIKHSNQINDKYPTNQQNILSQQKQFTFQSAQISNQISNIPQSQNTSEQIPFTFINNKTNMIINPKKTSGLTINKEGVEINISSKNLYQPIYHQQMNDSDQLNNKGQHTKYQDNLQNLSGFKEILNKNIQQYSSMISNLEEQEKGAQNQGYNQMTMNSLEFYILSNQFTQEQLELIQKDSQNVYQNDDRISLDNLKLCLFELYKNEYRITNTISKSGAQGIVYQGYNIKTQQQVAIKLTFPLIPLNDGDNTQTQQSSMIQTSFLDQIQTENMAINEIKCHQYIVKVYKQFLIKENLVVIQIMELCKCDLEEEINQRRQSKNPFTVKELIHVNGIVHLDIKPKNILKSNEGIYKLTDFGVANLFLLGETHCNAKGGTYKFCSPEQLLSLKGQNNSLQIRDKSDIYSVGLTLLNVLFLELSFDTSMSIRQGIWENIKTTDPSYLTLFTYLKYFMLNNDPSKRIKAIRLKEILIKHFPQQDINFNLDYQRINALIKNFKDKNISTHKYLSYLYFLLAQLNINCQINIEHSIKIAEKLLPKFELQDFLYFQSQKSKNLINLNLYQDSLNIFLKCLKEQRFLFNNQPHPDLAESLNNVAVSYERLGDDKKSQEYYLKALKMREALYSGDHPDLAQSLNSLAISYERLGDDKKSLEYKLRALKMREALYSGDHPDLAESLNNVAVSYTRLGDDKKSQEYYLKALQIREALYSGDHPYLAESLNNVAVSYERLGDDNKSQEYYLKALKMREALYSGDHPDLAQSLNSLAVSYERLGDDNKSQEYYLKALQMREALYSGDHPDLAESLNNVAVSYTRLGDDKKSLEYRLKAIKMREKLKNKGRKD